MSGKEQDTVLEGADALLSTILLIHSCLKLPAHLMQMLLHLEKRKQEKSVNLWLLYWAAVLMRRITRL